MSDDRKIFREILEKESKATLVLVLTGMLSVDVQCKRIIGRLDEESAFQLVRDELLKWTKGYRRTGRLENLLKRHEGVMSRYNEAVKLGGDCNECDFWRERGARKAGKRIPGGIGKCTRKGGHCQPVKVSAV